MSEWKINGSLFSALGLANLTRSRASCGVDVVSVTAPGTDYTSDPLFAYGAEVTITKDGDPWFLGQCRTIPRQGSAQSESITYEFWGAWWFLEKIVYEQNWKLWDEETSALANLYKSRVILCQNDAGERITIGAQISDAIDYAISKGATLQKGTITVPIEVPCEEAMDITVADVLIRLLRFCPDAVAWFDYSVNPPALNVVQGGEGTKTYNVAAGNLINQVVITPRYDIQCKGLILRFEQTSTSDGETYECTVLQTAGNVSDINAVVVTIPLAGSDAQWLSQKIITEAIPEDLTDQDFWKDHVPALASASLSFWIPEEPLRAGTLPRILKEGQIQNWMKEGGLALQSEDDIITAKMSVSSKDADGNVIDTIHGKIESLDIIATNAETKTYRKLSSFESGESIPAGMAASLYASWSKLQYDGSLSLEEEECTGVVSPGMLLNLSGGRAEWASMNAAIVRVEEDVDEGKTRITFGPNRQLQPEDLTVLLRGFRTRIPPRNYDRRQSGKTKDGANAVELNGPTPKNNCTTDGGQRSKMVVKDQPIDEGDYARTVTIDPSLIKPIKSDAAVDIKPREMDVCVDGVAMKCIFMCSEPYAPPA